MISFKHVLLLSGLISIVPSLSGQSQMLTMEEAVLKQRTTLAPEKIKALYWIPGKTVALYQGGGQNETEFHSFDASGVKSNLSLSRYTLNKQLKQNSLDTLTSLPVIHWVTPGSFGFYSGNVKVVFALQTQQLTPELITHFPEGFENADEAPTGQQGLWTAYTIGNNLFIRNPWKELAVTNDLDKNIVNGHSVHRDEFGISKGTFWSPTGKLLAFYRMDQTMVTDYPVMDLTKRPATANLIKYPMAGDKSHEVTVGIFNLSKNSTVFLKTGTPKDQYLTNIAWSPDEKHVYIAVLNRDQNHLWLNSYDAVTGDFEKTLFEEQDPKYVQPLHPMEFVKGKPDQFVWQSKRDGFNNLYLYDTGGKLIRRLTGNDATDLQVEELLGFDENGSHVLYQCSSKNDVIGRMIRSVSINDGTCKTLTPLAGTHSAKLNPTGGYLVDTYSSPQTPRTVKVITSGGKELQTLLTAPDPLKGFNLGKMKVFTLKSTDGMDLYCRMILPINFDSTKHYPVIDYLYGGPGVQLITNSWLAGADLWFQYMAEHGYVVFTLENRGSAGRGEAFEKATFRHLGTAEMEDQLKGVDYLKSLSYVDPERIGVFGWSFGGFMTTSLMTRHPGVFKTAVAGGPVIDWSYYEVMYTERYMDTPQTNAEGYAENSLLGYAKNLRGKLLIIHGTSDDVVVWQHSLLFLKACVDAGTQPDYFVYPGHLHNVLGKDRVHLFTKITGYFMQNL